MSLKQDMIKATFWGVADSIGSKIVRFVSSVLVARLLFPEQIGYIAMTYVFIECSLVFVNSGFHAALVQKKDVTLEDKNSVFYLNILIAIIATSALFFSARSIAVFFDVPILTDVIKVLSVVPIISALSIVPAAGFHKDLDFKTMCIANFTGVLCSSVVCLFMAYRGYGVWSLVAQQIVYPLITMLIFFFKSPFRPSLIFSISCIQRLSKYSLSLLASDVVNKLFAGLYFIVVGKFYSAAMLGFYSKADGLMRFSSTSFSMVLSKVTFSAVSKIQDDKERVKNIGKRVLGVTALTIPVLVFMSASAENLIPFLLTEKWVSTVPLFSLLCFVGVFHNLKIVNLDLLQSLGDSLTILKLHILHKALIAVTLLITYKDGLLVIIWGQILLMILMYIVSSIISGKKTNYGFSEQVIDCAPYAFYSVLVYAIAKSVNLYTDVSYGLTFLLQFVACSFMYTAMLRVTSNKELSSLLQIIRLRLNI